MYSTVGKKTRPVISVDLEPKSELSLFFPTDLKMYLVFYIAQDPNF
jgi:hypothetical protein